MNTTEVKVKNQINSFDDLFKYAKKQFLAYEKIEGIDNWKEYSFSIDCSQDQMKFKDMLQIRCVEELTEATHALDNEEHFLEEITDALNFFLSAYCMLDVDFKKLKDPGKILIVNYKPINLRLYLFGREKSTNYSNYSIGELYKDFYYIINDIGNLCNLLKNRPWAQSNYLVSMLDFDIRLNELWETFWYVMADIGLKKEEIFIMFEQKYIVNQWRIKTGY